MSEQIDRPTLFSEEEKILDFWQQHKIFNKSLERNPASNIFSFYDGPPFITGSPHYGTLLPSIAKDIIPRYQTMKGKRVRRIWGWDTHGLPAENQVEKQLGLKVKKDIETLGVDKFIAACRKYVATTSDAWKWYIDHIGRWVDMDNAYRTDSLNYMESVIWVFKQLYDKGLIYRGRRTSLYCPRCATPLSKFEVTMDDDSYRDVTDTSVTVSFRALGDDHYFLAWTTTPWTLPANLALAVDEKAEYVRVTDGHRQFVLAHQALERYRDLDFEILETFKGKKLVGQKYEPLYTFFPVNKDLDYTIYAADFVAMDEGTGIVHIAPGFGEEDTLLGEKVGLSLHETIDDEGHFVPDVEPWAKMYYKQANKPIREDLAARKHLIKESEIVHSYPHCYRCSTPLIYKAQVSWYLKLDPIREQLLANNKKINWVPKHFGSKRFAYNIQNAPDWSLSRTRYWGTPLPVWETEDGEIFIPGSISELEKLSGEKITDLHRPLIDEVILKLPNGKKAKRVKEVLDVWFESGSMPFAQDHYPFDSEGNVVNRAFRGAAADDNKEIFAQHYPTQFIIEYTGQLRGWFYYLHLLGNAVQGENAFKNVVVHGVLAGNDGRKMSKSYGNYPDPKETIEKYGGEALRLYFMGSRIMSGEDIAISENDIREQSRLISILHNSLGYYQTYAKVNQFTPNEKSGELGVMDRWIKARLEEFILRYSKALDEFDFASSTKQIRPFIEDLSTWYIRRGRERFASGDKAALQTLHYLLGRFATAVAPTLPFSAEKIWQDLGLSGESVHLADYPSPNLGIINDEGDLLDQMRQVRQIASAAHMQRAEAGVSLRQPVSSLAVEGFESLSVNEELIQVLQEEVNVQEIVFGQVNPKTAVAVGEGQIFLDPILTEEMKVEGRYRELLRQLQDARKKAGLEVGQLATLNYFTRDEELRDLINKRSRDITKHTCLRSLKLIKDEVGLQKINREEMAVKFS